MFRKSFNDMGKCSQLKLCGGKDNIQINIQYYPKCLYMCVENRRLKENK